jgi:hypothetical protein
MGDNELIRIRPAVAEDATAVAQAHVRSWQAGYRGLLPANYLDALRPEDRASRYTFDQMRPDGPFTRTPDMGTPSRGHTSGPTCDYPDSAVKNCNRNAQ